MRSLQCIILFCLSEVGQSHLGILNYLRLFLSILILVSILFNTFYYITLAT